jgi:hypothetical protein
MALAVAETNLMNWGGLLIHPPFLATESFDRSIGENGKKGCQVIMFFLWFRKLFLKEKPEDHRHLIRPIHKQIKAWHKANRKMGWGIKGEEFDNIGEPPALTEDDRQHGYIGTVLFYGFGDDGQGNADPVVSGKVAWDYARKNWRKKTWQCEYIDFDKTDHIRLRPEAPPRPKGFYYAKFQPGGKYHSLTVSQLRKSLNNETGCGPEGLQFLSITHTHFQGMMNDREIPFMAFADYDIAPYGFNDFFDAAQMFCSTDVLGLGIGNVDGNYPFFGIPTILLLHRPEAIENTS